MREKKQTIITVVIAAELMKHLAIDKDTKYIQIEVKGEGPREHIVITDITHTAK